MTDTTGTDGGCNTDNLPEGDIFTGSEYPEGTTEQGINGTDLLPGTEEPCTGTDETLPTGFFTDSTPTEGTEPTECYTEDDHTHMSTPETTNLPGETGTAETGPIPTCPDETTEEPVSGHTEAPSGESTTIEAPIVTDVTDGFGTPITTAEPIPSVVPEDVKTTMAPGWQQTTGGTDDISPGVKPTEASEGPDGSQPPTDVTGADRNVTDVPQEIGTGTKVPEGVTTQGHSPETMLTTKGDDLVTAPDQTGDAGTQTDGGVPSAGTGHSQETQPTTKGTAGTQTTVPGQTQPTTTSPKSPEGDVTTASRHTHEGTETTKRDWTTKPEQAGTGHGPDVPPSTWGTTTLHPLEKTTTPQGQVEKPTAEPGIDRPDTDRPVTGDHTMIATAPSTTLPPITGQVTTSTKNTTEETSIGDEVTTDGTESNPNTEETTTDAESTTTPTTSSITTTTTKTTATTQSTASTQSTVSTTKFDDGKHCHCKCKCKCRCKCKCIKKGAKDKYKKRKPIKMGAKKGSCKDRCMINCAKKCQQNCKKKCVGTCTEYDKRQCALGLY